MDDINSVNELYDQVCADIISNLDYDGFEYEIDTSSQSANGILLRLPSPVSDGYVAIRIEVSEDSST